MNHTNIISAYQSILAIEQKKVDISNIKKILGLKIHEAKTLQCFCSEILSKSNDNAFEILDGYYLNYSIKQIGKEFDLLRFGKNFHVNIELKSKDIIKSPEKISIIHSQMKKNYYYLKALNKKIGIYTFVENENLYMYNHTADEIKQIQFEDLITVLTHQNIDINMNPDDLFKPSKYLISPFNNTKKFIEETYFLNDAQKNIKGNIILNINNEIYNNYSISANAGTGKTLLLYDIVKTLIKDSKNPIIIHCGILNSGHYDLITNYNWNIKPIKDITSYAINGVIPDNTDAVFIDEAQRINIGQLSLILKRSNELKITAVFSGDKKQFLKSGEDKDVYKYIKETYPDIPIQSKTLTNKIRTNKEISSFITNLLQIGKSDCDLDYRNITIEYFDSYSEAKNYMLFLLSAYSWTPITFSDSIYNNESITPLANIGFINAHSVIGQEFDKVVFAMDNNFRYNNGRLQGNKTYFSLDGMLYQIVTRVVNELKIIVIDNPELYSKLLEIKSMDLNP